VLDHAQLESPAHACWSSARQGSFGAHTPAPVAIQWQSLCAEHALWLVLCEQCALARYASTCLLDEALHPAPSASAAMDRA
jgi:hypothetical protein